MRYALLAFILLTLGGWGALSLGGGVPAAGGGGGSSATMFEDFESYTEADWEEWAGLPANRCSDVTGQLEINGSGLCHPIPATYTHPTSVDQWVLYEHSANGQEETGPGFRILSTDPGGSDNSFAVRCSSSVLIIRSCTAGDGCTTHHTTSVACTTGTDDAIGVAVAGTGDSTEFCIWNWSASPPDPTTTAGPDDWGNADECAEKTHTTDDPMTLLAAFEDCGGTTDCVAFSAGGSFVAENSNKHVAVYRGAAGTAEVEGFAAGDLGL